MPHWHFQVFNTLQDKPETYATFLDRYCDLQDNDKMKRAMTDIAFHMAQKVWTDLPAESRGNCFFCIGGVNAINPFSATVVKNEIAVYVDAIGKEAKRIEPSEGTFYDMDGARMGELDLSHYDEIYMDFNGSMAFFTEAWKQRLSVPSVAAKVHLHG